MPKLNEYISVGFCSGYGDGDYRVSMAVRELSRERYNELRLAVLGALNCADRHWMEAQAESQKANSATDLGPGRLVPHHGSGPDNL